MKNIESPNVEEKLLTNNLLICIYKKSKKHVLRLKENSCKPQQKV